MSHRIDIEQLTIMPRTSSEGDYEQAGCAAVRAPEVIQGAQTVWAGCLRSYSDVQEFTLALRSYFLERGAPLYFIMAGDEPKGPVT